MWQIEVSRTGADMNCFAMQAVGHSLSRTKLQLLRRWCALGFALALLLARCSAQSLGNGRERFADVALKLRAFPPDSKFFAFMAMPMRSVDDLPRLSGPPMDMKVDIANGWPVPPGTTEYRALLRTDYPTPFLLSLFKDADPKIRTLAAAALVAKGDPRLQRDLAPLVHDHSPTFDIIITTFSTAHYAPPHYRPQTVSEAVLRLADMPSEAMFDRYWAARANRE
jgi:hypothetical protein